MGKSKGIPVIRKRAALQRLESAYEIFKAGGEDKKPHESTRNGRKIYHEGRTYAEECDRMSKEIVILKGKISKQVS